MKHTHQKVPRSFRTAITRALDHIERYSPADREHLKHLYASLRIKPSASMQYHLFDAKKHLVEPQRSLEVIGHVDTQQRPSSEWPVVLIDKSLGAHQGLTFATHLVSALSERLPDTQLRCWAFDSIAYPIAGDSNLLDALTPAGQSLPQRAISKMAQMKQWTTHIICVSHQPHNQGEFHQALYSYLTLAHPRHIPSLHVTCVRIVDRNDSMGGTTTTPTRLPYTSSRVHSVCHVSHLDIDHHANARDVLDFVQMLHVNQRAEGCSSRHPNMPTSRSS